MAESNLLAYLAIYCRVDYISDLKLTQNCKQIITTIKPTTFPLKEWNDAVQYLCKNKKSFNSVEQAKEYLMKY